MFCLKYWAPILGCDSAQYLCRVKKISMTSNVLSLYFAPSQASSSQSSNVDNFWLYCEVDSLKPSSSESSLPYTRGHSIITWTRRRRWKVQVGHVKTGRYLISKMSTFVHLRGLGGQNVVVEWPLTLIFKNFPDKITIPISLARKNLLQTVIRLKKKWVFREFFS